MMKVSMVALSVAVLSLACLFDAAEALNRATPRFQLLSRCHALPETACFRTCYLTLSH